MSTSALDIRAGSVVLPLHHPVRVAEEWSVVDNLARGRVGLSLASGWHSTDFVLAPDRYADRREQTISGVGLLRRLWAGEPVALRDGVGELVEVRVCPPPFSPDLPLWLTTSGNPRTWADAGRLGTGVLAASIGQTREELRTKILAYRSARAACPPAPAGARSGVVLMMHAFVGDNDDEVRARVRDPLREYLRSFVRQAATSRTGAGERALGGMNPAERDLVVEFAFERYLAWGSLLGTPTRCRSMLAELEELGVDEVACFVDFGLGLPDALACLQKLRDLNPAPTRRRAPSAT